MKTILITISRGSLIRNFFHSGVVSQLAEAGHRVLIATPDYDRPEVFAPYLKERVELVPYPPLARWRGQPVMGTLFKAAVFNTTVHQRWRYRLTGEPPLKWAYPLRMAFLSWLRFVPGIKPGLRFLSRILDPQPQCDAYLKTHAPDLVFVTTPHERAEAALLKAAKRSTTISVAMPKSWDNLSKWLLPVKAPMLIVWSDFMKEQAVRLQDYRPHEVVVSGAPQFDHYAKEERLLSREAFCRKNNLDPDKKIILYGSSGGGMCREADYVAFLRDCMEDGALPDAQVFVRPHLGYVGDAKQFEEVATTPSVVLDRHDKQDTRLRDNWDISIAHLDHLFNSLYHADVCINAASTLTIDAACCNTPSVNIRFDLKKDVPPTLRVERLYKADYVAAVTSTGASLVARSPEEFVQALRRVLYDEDFTLDLTPIVSHFAYRVDGKAAERIARTLLAQLR